MYMKKWIMICACVAVFQTALAQRITRQYNNVSFSAALKDLNARQHKYTINFAVFGLFVSSHRSKDSNLCNTISISFSAQVFAKYGNIIVCRFHYLSIFATNIRFYFLCSKFLQGFLAIIVQNTWFYGVFYYLCIGFLKKIEDFFILGVIDFRKACI